MQQHFRIMGSARYLPPKRISAEELDTKLGFLAGTTFSRTGVQFRHEAVAPESAATMAKIVIHDALAKAQSSIKEIDFLIDASLCVQQPIPCNAALIQEALGPQAAGIPCLDVHASCLGFVAALNVVNGLFASGAARRAMVVCAETPMRGVNWKEPESACLMGDGASAFLFEAVAPSHRCVLAMETFAEGAHWCQVQGGGHLLPSYDYNEARSAQYRFHMEGKVLHKLASRLLPPLFERVLREAQCTLNDLEVVPHQASGPALAFMAHRLKIPAERFHATIAQHGNLVSASIPFVLHELCQQKPSGTRVMLAGTAAGYTQAVCIFTL